MESVDAKLERAREHLSALDAELLAFTKGTKHNFVLKTDATLDSYAYVARLSVSSCRSQLGNDFEPLKIRAHHGLQQRRKTA
jgi:hypothetical protein